MASGNTENLNEPFIKGLHDDNKAEFAPTMDFSSSREKIRINGSSRGLFWIASRILFLTSMWTVFLIWILLLVIYPTHFFQGRILPLLREKVATVYFGRGGLLYLLFAAPVMVIVLLGTVYSAYFLKDNWRYTRPRQAGLSLWTFPVLIDGLLGVVSIAELFFVALFVVYLLWAMWNYLSNDFSLISEFRSSFTSSRWSIYVAFAGVRLGIVGFAFLGFLFLPISRGSILLRLIDIPFEHATKYHVWLGHFVMAIFTAHGLAFVIVWAVQGHLLSELIAWQNVGVANLPGVIALVAGWAMWVTSLYPIRQSYFETFFYTHQLYVIFIVFMVFHAGDSLLGLTLAGIFLFLIDRFLRFCQSRRLVSLLAARVFPCSTIELVLSKPPGLNYNALSFVFINIPSLSRLEWHPFSVSSSPLDGANHIAVLIKPLGSWTHKLKEAVAEVNGKNSPFPISMSVEGPYGHESNFYLRYDNLILVAGGIGISPFVALLRDLLHRYQNEEENLPRNILLIWSVKSSKELGILDLVEPASIYPNYDKSLEIDVRTYVTRERAPNLESGQEDILTSAKLNDNGRITPMCPVVGTGSDFWYGMCALSCTIGFVVATALFGKYMISSGEGSYFSVPLWVRGGYALLSMLLAVVGFGGIVVALWMCSGIRLRKKGFLEKAAIREHLLSAAKQSSSSSTETTCERLVQLPKTRYGCRPDLQELFGDASKRWEKSNVGVLLCGPPSLQSSVAEECRRCNWERIRKSGAAFHYHALSFDL